MSTLEVVAYIDRAGRAMNALKEIERLHAPVTFPSGRMLCTHCCFEDSGQQTQDCIDSHEHSTGPACATAEVIARAGL